nr:PAS domain S-box protein [uncultured Caldimonas sp.]
MERASKAWRYAAALGVLLLALLLRWLLLPVLDDRLPYLPLYGAVAAVLWFGGLRLAFAVAVLGFATVEAAVPWLPLDPAAWRAGLPLRAFTYGVSCAVVLGGGHALRRVRHTLRQEQERVRQERSERNKAEQRALLMELAEARSASQAAAVDARLAAVLRHVGDAIVACSVQGRIVAWNPAAERMFGYTESEALGQPVSMLVPSHAAGEREALLQQAEQQQLASAETVRVARDGRRIEVLLRVAAMRNADGQLLGYTASMQDIGERKRTEEALRRSEATLRAFYDNSPVCMGVVEAVPVRDLLHLYDNPVTCRLFGLPPGGTAHRRATEMGASAQTIASWRRAYGRSLRTGKPVQFEYRLDRAEGVRWLTATVCPIGRGPTGRHRFCYVSEDVTERYQAQLQLREADRRKDEFLATLAHELRNPLAPLQNGVEILRLRGGDAQVRQQAIDMMARQLAHMVHLVDDLLDLRRITTGRLELRRERVPLHAVLDRAVETSQRLLHAEGHALRYSPPPDHLVVEGDVTRLTQVFGNLLNNAAKYTPHGGAISIDVWLDGEDAVIEVADNGIGIPEAMLTRVFEMFAQVDRAVARSQGGLGIGLALARRLVEMHGGTITARSEGEGRGSCFSVRLPVLQDEPPASAPLPGRAQHAVRRGCKVLIADDNTDAAGSLAELLALEGHETFVVHDGLAAVSAARDFRPDVVLLDLGMPRLAGDEAARLIRRGGPDAPLLVAVTGWGQAEDLQRTKEAGFHAHLVKPVDLDALRQVLQLRCGVPGREAASQRAAN